MTNTSHAFGSISEDYACKQLKRLGFKIIARNYRCKHGEIDIIAIDKQILVFVEVKARSGFKYGTPLEAISQSKITKISQTGEHFILNSKISSLPHACRIDVAAIMNDGKQLSFEHFIGVDR